MQPSDADGAAAEPEKAQPDRQTDSLDRAGRGSVSPAVMSTGNPEFEV